MRSLIPLLTLAPSGCAVVVQKLAVAEPVLLAPMSQPIPDGLIATDPQRVEVRACGAEYVGLDALIARAQADRDGLIQVVVDMERHWEVWGYGRNGTITGEVHTLPGETRCYTLRAYKVTFRGG